jgi:mannose-6-phosphate isomerase-like protein (cupin superfamily)
MSFNIRRVVTGHDASGRTAILIDGHADNPTSRRPGHASQLIWTTDRSPAGNRGDSDAGAVRIGRPPPANGTIFRIMEIQPGGQPEMHNTDTVDYVVVMTGRIHMEMDDGAEVVLDAGNVMVQRGTNHSWHNRGDVPCRIAVVLVDAEPLTDMRA